MEKLELYEKVRSVPDNAKKTIKGGRLNGMTDINPIWRIKTLTEQFGPCGIGWYYMPVKKWLEMSGDEVAAFVDIELYIKVGDEWSKPIVGTGGSKFVSQEKSGIHVSDECYKMATTDAISVACKQLGIGADVYWESDKTKYDPLPTKLSKKQIDDLFTELKRTGIGMKNMCKHYKVSSLEMLSEIQYRDAMDTLKSKPNKPVDPATIPPDEPEGGLPWNQPGV